MTLENRYRDLLAALGSFVLDHAHPQLDKFKPALRDWGSRYQAVEPAQLPVAGYLDAAQSDASGASRDLLQPFTEHNHCLHWEQSYRRQDKLVPDAMLDAYGFAEIIGLRGPFVSERMRAGIAAWGPEIEYPQHHHQAEEAYILLGGSAEFHLPPAPAATHCSGDVVYVASNQPHGFRTGSKPLLVCYLWQAGNLRQTSRFAD